MMLTFMRRKLGMSWSEVRYWAQLGQLLLLFKCVVMQVKQKLCPQLVRNASSIVWKQMGQRKSLSTSFFPVTVEALVWLLSIPHCDINSSFANPNADGTRALAIASSHANPKIFPQNSPNHQPTPFQPCSYPNLHLRQSEIRTLYPNSCQLT